MSRTPDDVRSRITEHGFRLEPSLLGTPLSTPRRRLVALLFDLLVIAILASAPAFVLGLALAVVLVRVVASPARLPSRWTRRAAAVGVAVIAFALAVSAWNSVERLMDDDVPERAGTGDGNTVEIAGSGRTVEMEGVRGVVAATALLAFTQADDEATAIERGDRLIAILQEEGSSDADILGLLNEMADMQPGRPWLAATAEAARLRLASAETPVIGTVTPAEPLANLVDRWSAALMNGDSAGAAAASITVRERLAGDTIQYLSELADRERELADRMAAALEASESRGEGVLPFIRRSLADLGLGLGWSSLYFTAFLVLWSGQTPGKRLFRIRVVRLDGKPIGWWTALERFGGYTAGLGTGLLGFLQVFWDRNRQAIQDKISETVVVKL